MQPLENATIFVFHLHQWADRRTARQINEAGSWVKASISRRAQTWSVFVETVSTWISCFFLLFLRDKHWICRVVVASQPRQDKLV